MASENLRPERESGNKRSHEGADVGGETEIVLLKARVSSVEAAVSDIRTGVQKLLERPSNPGFTQVITTLVLTFTFCGFIFGLAEWRISQAVTPINAELAGMKQKADWAADSVHAANVKAAVLEERVAWIRAAQGKAP